VFDGSLILGDKVFVTIGDTSGGSRGARAQSFVNDDFDYKVAVESFQTGVFYDVPGDMRLRIVSAEAARLVVLAPSHALPGEKVSLTVKAQDRFGNPASTYRGTVEFKAERVIGLPERHAFVDADQGIRRFDGVSFIGPGTYRLSVVDEDRGFLAQSNPIEVTRAESSRGLSVFWGDFHGQTRNSVGTGTVEQYFHFAKHTSALDFTAHNANDFQVLREHWDEVKEVTKRYNRPGEFVTFLGSEWSGTTPAGGDHNIYYLEDDKPLHRSSHWQIPDRSDESTDCYPVSELYRVLKEEGNEAMVIPHVGGRYANLDYHDPDLEPVVEICSTHGYFEWLLQDAIRRGYKVGVVGSSDDHSGRQGATYPMYDRFPVRGGLAGVYAEGRTREAIWKALKARRCYATTGERIILGFEMDGHMMGEEVRTSRLPSFRVRVAGTSGIHECELKRGLRVIHRFRPPCGKNPNRLRVEWGGARIRSRERQTQWDGGLRLSGGRILAVEQFAFDAPWKGVQGWDSSCVTWRSTTAGDIDGIMVDVDAPDDATLVFETPTKSFEVRLCEIRRKGLYIDAGLLEQHVSISLAPACPNPADVDFEFTDEHPLVGTQPYYVKVIQDDGEMAWSSPIFVVYVDTPRG
jgi:hypothetical protein